jgi:hypothetical protein
MSIIAEQFSLWGSVVVVEDVDSGIVQALKDSRPNKAILLMKIIRCHFFWMEKHDSVNPQRNGLVVIDFAELRNLVEAMLCINETNRATT